MSSLESSDSGFNSEEENAPQCFLESLQHCFMTAQNSKPLIEILEIENINQDFTQFKIKVNNKDEKEILQDNNEKTLYLKIPESERIEFEFLGWLSTVKDGDKTRGIILSYRQKKARICIQHRKLMMSLHSEHFYQFVYKYFENDFIYDHSNKTWYFTENGKWKNHKNGGENFILSKKIKSDITYLYENTGKQKNKEFYQYEEKLKKPVPYRIERGSIKKTEYIPCKLFLKTGEKESEIKNTDSFEDFKKAVEADKEYQICKYYYEKCLDADKFIPNAIKALRENFSQSNVDEKFDNDPYTLSFNNCYIDLLKP